MENIIISLQRRNTEKINVNMINNKLLTYNLIRNSKANYEKKNRNKTTSIVMGERVSEMERGNKEIKNAKRKMIKGKLDNPSKKESNTNLLKIFVKEQKLKSINAQDTKQRRDLKLNKSKEIHGQKQKNDKIEKILNYKSIIMLLLIIINNKSYISELKLKRNLNYEMNSLFIYIFNIIKISYFLNEKLLYQSLISQHLDYFNQIKDIIFFLIMGIITFIAKRILKSIFNIGIRYINECSRQIMNFIQKILLFKGINKLIDITSLNERTKSKKKDEELKVKKEKERKNTIIKNYITNNNLIKVIIKPLVIINLFCITISSIYDFNLFKESKITLKVKGKGEKTIFNNNFRQLNYLTKVQINEIIKSEKTYKYTFDQENNTVELFWDENIDSTANMFKECPSITEINLSNFDSSKVKSLDYMFEGCSSLTSIALSNINTKSVERMTFMFSRCTSLTSLDLSHFDTSSVTTMDSMFSHCSSLSSLDLSKFDSSSLSSMDSIFLDCTNLEYVNLEKFNVNKLKQAMFENVPNNLAICIQGNIDNLFSSTSNYLYNSSYSSSTNQKCFVNDCSNNWKTKQNKIINNNNNQCIDSCDKTSEYKYEYNGKCIKACPKGTLSGNNKCKCELDKCLLCPPVALKNKLCTQCNTGYYPKENDASNLGEYIDCYKNLEGYYLDNNLYKKCYETCKTCDSQGNSENHNCISCNENFPFIIEKNNKFNCLSNCSYYYYKKENNYYCTKELNCTVDYPKLKHNSRECTDLIDVEDIIKAIAPPEKGESKLQQMNYYNNILQNIDTSFTSPNYDISNIQNGKDEIIITEQMTITFTTTENQKNNLYNNMTSIDLGECETLLRNFYHLSINETLYIKKLDIVQEETKALKVEYDVYCKLNGKNLEKLNLTICGETKISLLIPFNINKDLDKFNTSSGYYNDICYTTTSDDGTDISLKDRKSDYANNDLVVCQEGCIFTEYDFERKVAKCKCDAKESPSSIADMKIDKAKLLENFKDIKNIVNFEFLKCYKILFTKEGILNNYGCYIIFIIFLFHILSIFIFRVNSFQILEKKIISIAIKKSKEQSNAVKGIKDIKKNQNSMIKIFSYIGRKKKKIQKNSSSAIKNLLKIAQ